MKKPFLKRMGDFLEGKGFTHVGTWQFEQAKQLIDRIAANGWRIPRGIDPKTYMG